MVSFLLVLLLGGAAWAQTDKPLRIFIRAGVKTHGPDQHDHPRFLSEWTELLNQRGAKCDGGMDFPTSAQLANTDVLVMYAGDAGDITPDQRVYFGEFLQRGGGIVVIHDAICGHDPDWFKTVVGGAWRYGKAKYFEGDLSFYYLNHTSPITRDVSNFDFDDEEYWDLDLESNVTVLAGTYQPDDRFKREGRALPSIYDVAPQMWTYEKDNYRAFVSIPGHNHKSFNLPHYRAVLLRGIAWAGRRDADLLVSKDELASLRYPEGGPTRPEEAVKKIFVPPDFNLKLVASEPLIEKPISMDWDSKGRLWIAETPEYPYREDRERPPRDRISILESSRGDGYMDKKEIFYEGLDLVTSLVFYKDGVIVSQAPDIYWLRDTGTGKADTKITLFKGFGNYDTHAVISNLRWGMDGWIYATVGYSRGDIYSGDGSKHFGPISDGVFRFRPDGSAIEQVSSKGGNTWGVDIAPDGEVFFTQANGSHIDHVVLPEPVLARGHVDKATSYLLIEDHNKTYPMMSWTKQAYMQIDWVGNFTAAAGCCIYDGGAWPEKYDYTHYVSEPTINIVHQDFIRPKGVSYVASKDPDRLEKEFVASTDLWFRPIHQRVGPDGALYILDFYNQAVVHNDTRGTRHDPKDNASIRPDRDHYFGRIWRVQHNEAKKLDLPKLDANEPDGLVAALNHPNEWVRMTALRLLLERDKKDVAPELEALAKSESASTYARIHALWALNDLGVDERSLDLSLLKSEDTDLKKAALNVAAISPLLNKSLDFSELATAVASQMTETNERVRLEALVALQNLPVDDSSAEKLMAVYPSLTDSWSQSAFLGVTADHPLTFVDASLRSQNPSQYGSLVRRLAAQIADKPDMPAVAKLIIALSKAPAAEDELKQTALESLAHELEPADVVPWSPELRDALKAFLESTNDELSSLALPLAARWETNNELTAQVKPLITKISSSLADASQNDLKRMQAARSLLAVRQFDSTILASVAALLGSSASTTLQHSVIESIGGQSDAAAGRALVDAYPNLNAELQNAALNQIFKRADRTGELLDAIQAGKISLGTLGPVAINRLRTYNDHAVSERANKLIDSLRGPETKEKDALIAKFTPIVTQPGDAARGKELFKANCAVCHRFNGEGKDVAPDLTGMGAHGPATLIVHVLDPNREVEPNYFAYDIETLDGEVYEGVLARENSRGITLKNAAGETEIRTENIKSRRNTGRTIMPNGFEALGAETLRDILAYICAGEANFRLLDLRDAFNANSLRGLWLSESDTNDTLKFKKFGLVKEGDVPFEIANPQKVSSGKNLIVLKGGSGYAKSQPQRVEIPNVNVKATKLHFLATSAWGYPWGGESKKDLPACKITVHHSGGGNEEFLLKNGEEIADWNGNASVPGSKDASDLLKRGQVRWFTKVLKNPDIIQSITLESFDNDVSPTFVAITAELGNGTAPAETSAAAAPIENAKPASREFKWTPGTTHVLIVGGGSSHDFNRWFNEDDSTTLASRPKTSVNYTDKYDDVLAALKDVDVLVWSANQPMTDEKLEKALMDFADAGHGLVLLHPGVWYNWNNWPDYNRVLVGGGAHGHDRYGQFTVEVKKTDHPVMRGVPGEFGVADELYHTEIDPKGTPVEILAEAKNPQTGAKFASVWTVKHPKARIVCIALGHDSGSHDTEAYKTILKNAVAWCGGK